MSEEILERKEKIIKEIELYFPKNVEQTKMILNRITNEVELKNELDKIETIINNEKSKFTNVNYANENGDTYYADVKEDKIVYDPMDKIDSEVIKSSLDTATKDYLDLNPRTIHNEKEYSNLINVDILFDDQIGYRVVENENGLFHGIQKESSWYIYPSNNIDLNNPKNVELCNTLFNTTDKIPIGIGDKIDFDGINAAEIFMPFVAVVDDPINNLTYADVLVSQGITVDPSFENSKIKDPTVPKIKNKITKGKLTVKERNNTKEEFGFQEDLILEPKKYIEGTFIPYPRNKRADESEVEYNTYLMNYYKKHNYEIQYDKNGIPVYPHEQNQEQHEKVIDTKDEVEENFGFDSFLKNKYGLDTSNELESSILLAHLKAYRAYLNNLTITNETAKSYINTLVEDTENIIDDIKTNSLL